MGSVLCREVFPFSAGGSFIRGSTVYSLSSIEKQSIILGMTATES